MHKILQVNPDLQQTRRWGRKHSDGGRRKVGVSWGAHRTALETVFADTPLRKTSPRLRCLREVPGCPVGSLCCRRGHGGRSRSPGVPADPECSDQGQGCGHSGHAPPLTEPLPGAPSRRPDRALSGADFSQRPGVLERSCPGHFSSALVFTWLAEECVCVAHTYLIPTITSSVFSDFVSLPDSC